MESKPSKYKIYLHEYREASQADKERNKGKRGPNSCVAVKVGIDPVDPSAPSQGSQTINKRNTLIVNAVK